MTKFDGWIEWTFILFPWEHWSSNIFGSDDISWDPWIGFLDFLYDWLNMVIFKNKLKCCRSHWIFNSLCLLYGWPSLTRILKTTSSAMCGGNALPKKRLVPYRPSLASPRSNQVLLSFKSWLEARAWWWKDLFFSTFLSQEPQCIGPNGVLPIHAFASCHKKMTQ